MIFSLIGEGFSFSVMLAIFLAYIVVLLFSFTIHEFSHGLAAYLHGDLTAKACGRLTLNPLAHLDVLGVVSLLIFGFGWAKPVPVNPMNLRDGKRGMFAVAIAGVLANLVLAFLFSLIYTVVYKYAGSVFQSSSFASVFLTYFLHMGMLINLYLFVFNLFPLFPLDGSKVLELVLKPNNRVLEFLRKYSMIILLILLIVPVFGNGYQGGIMSWIISNVSNTIINWFLSLWGLIFGV